jgi:formate hydrogenlyase subunit 3/multisubunit Na+/H+ antiporter MnhD subunit
VVYIGLVALVQSDMKKLIAYSSIAHMGFVTLGFFLFNPLGIEGGLVQMISHGFISAAMFLCVGVMYDRVHSRQIADYGGVANTMPRFAAFFMLFAMANAGLPATSGFVGEFMVILGAVQVNFWWAFLAATTLIFGAAYTLWMYKRVVFGRSANEHVAEMKDINSREFVVSAACSPSACWAWALSAALHRGDARLGGTICWNMWRTANWPIPERRRTTMIIPVPDFLPALPEIFVLAWPAPFCWWMASPKDSVTMPMC